MTRALLLVLSAWLSACAAAPQRGPNGAQALPPVGSIVDSRSLAALDFSDFVAQLAQAEVVFLGELHDSDAAHDLQQRTLAALGDARGTLVLSLEMFERDAQVALDAYLSGASDEASFLAQARPWPNYAEHYRPMVELARERGWRVLAANVPRPLAARVARGGLGAVRGESFLPRWVEASPGAYFERFAAAMGMHGDAEQSAQGLENWYRAQCLKDDAMAEAIADARFAAGDPIPLVVHLNGRFHSDERLGTVERLLLRQPGLEVRVVSSVPAEEWRELRDSPERAARLADYLWLLP